jgi:multidrug resistance efflux pump
MNKMILPVMWLSAIGVGLLLSTQLKKETTHFFGIADNREQVVSFSYPVQIEKIQVLEGQQVSAGEVVLRVIKRDIYTQKSIIDDQIDEVQSRYEETVAADTAELESLRAQKQASIAELDARIRRLQSQNQLNLKILSQLTGSSEGREAVRTNPLLSELGELKRQRDHIALSMQAQINAIASRLQKTHNRPVDAKLSELRERKSELEQQETDLVVKTTIAGRVGSIMYKEREQVAPFQPILTIHSETPLYVKGYIHEDVQNGVRLGQQVWVKSNSQADMDDYYKGVVESLGNRIVEYPNRLRKNPLVLAWGREVVIGIADANRFLAGEKVDVFLGEPESIPTKISKLFSNNLMAAFASDTRLASSDEDMKMDNPGQIMSKGD